MSENKSSRRDFLKKAVVVAPAAYVAPAVLTLSAKPALASQGSRCDQGIGWGALGEECDPGRSGYAPTGTNDEGGQTSETGPGKNPNT